jgi:hypothetical protein
VRDLRRSEGFPGARQRQATGRSTSPISLQRAQLQPDLEQDGVINEYCEACEATVDGVGREVPLLEELDNPLIKKSLFQLIPAATTGNA